ncbi:MULTISPECIES: ATP-binding protein [unclassified Streptomyces]|uniref:ATP-binding protein n=1 Tax=unclassified Streptomyces TaxID=2593676 RepID=UPI00099D004F|nr:ATP-binding protein [Streptomyces sp. NRRL F-2747]
MRGLCRVFPLRIGQARCTSLAEGGCMDLPVLDRSLSRGGQPTASARDATRAFLHRATRIRPPAAPGNGDAVLLVVDELVANAMRHTRGSASLHLELNGDHIDICVTDTSPDRPTPRRPHLDGTGGWGWQLINHLATDVHIDPTPEGGKAICARAPW